MKNGIYTGLLFILLFGNNAFGQVPVPPSVVPPNRTPPSIDRPLNYPQKQDEQDQAAQPPAPQFVRQPEAGATDRSVAPETQGGMRVYDIPRTGAPPAGYSKVPQEHPRSPAPVVAGQPGLRQPQPVVRQPNGAQPAGGVVTAGNIAPPIPFVLNPEEENRLSQFLAAWEKYGAQVTDFKSQFTCYTYDVLKVNDQMVQNEKYSTYGNFQYCAPNKMLFQVTGEWVNKKFVEYKEDWQSKTDMFMGYPLRVLCDGSSLYYFDFQKPDKEKTVLKRKLSADELAAGTMNGPLPLIFGAKAQDMKARYYLRLVTPQDYIGTQIWLEAYPKWPGDAVEFKKITLMLDHKTFLPKALERMNVSENEKLTFVFNKPVVNEERGVFQSDPFNLAKYSRGFKVVDSDDMPSNPQEVRNGAPNPLPTAVPVPAAPGGNGPVRIVQNPNETRGGRIPLYTPPK